MKKPKRKRWTVRWYKAARMWKVTGPITGSHPNRGWEFCVLHRCDNPSCVNPDHLFELLPTKHQAVLYGRTIAKRNKPSQLIVCKKDGTYEAEYTYGNDPFPPKG